MSKDLTFTEFAGLDDEAEIYCVQELDLLYIVVRRRKVSLLKRVQSNREDAASCRYFLNHKVAFDVADELNRAEKIDPKFYATWVFDWQQN